MGDRFEMLRGQFGVRVAPLVFGLGFIALGVVGLGGDVDGRTAWLWATLLAAAGITGLVLVVRAIVAGPEGLDES